MERFFFGDRFAIAASLALCLLAAPHSANAEDPASLDGIFMGVQGNLTVPHFQRDIVGADREFGPNDTLKVFSFDWDADGAYKGWLGREWANGFGITLSHFYLNHSTKLVEQENGGQIQVNFDTDSTDADIGSFPNFGLEGGALVALSKFDLDVTDIEAWQKLDFGALMLRVGAGVRFAKFDRSYLAYETLGPESVGFDHSFRGAGPSLNYDAEVPIAMGISLYNAGRAALLFGEHRSSFVQINDPDERGSMTNYAMLPTLDMSAGLQWRGVPWAGAGELTVRAGVDAQTWFGGGGWDMNDDDGGATFPQNAGNFGLISFNASAQYKFGGPSDDTRSRADLPDIVASGLFFGAEGAFITPYFNRDIQGADENVGPADALQILSFDWDGDGSYKAWVGYEFASGLGLRVSHSAFNHSVGFFREEGDGRLEVHFDPEQDDLDIFVNQALRARSQLEMDVTDVEFWQTVDLNAVTLRFGAGFRVADIQRSYLAIDTAPGNDTAHFKHDFDGVGPSLNFESDIPIARGFSIYNATRAAILFGEHRASYREEPVITNNSGSLSNYSLVPTLDNQIGLQWRGIAAGGELTLRAGVDTEVWFGAGGWDLYRDDGAAPFPQHTGSFGLIGVNASAQYKFGADPETLNRSRSNLPEIVAQGFFVGAAGSFVIPHFEQDTAGINDSSGGPEAAEVLSFDWEGDGAYKIWAGYEWASGFGLKVSHASFQNSTRFFREEGPNDTIEVHFDPDTDDADIRVDGALDARTKLAIDVTDAALWQKVNLNVITLRVGGGVRYAEIDRTYFAYETQGNEFVRANHSFEGAGPSVHYEAELPIAAGFSFYNFGRAALLFGEHKTAYEGEETQVDSGSRENYGLLPTLDGELGVQWRGEIFNGSELTLRAGLEAQAWVEGGGWDMIHNDPGTLFPQDAGSFGLWGATAGAQVKF